jgi:serine/threonine-protein kinase
LSLPDGLFAPHEVVRTLGARSNPPYVLRQAGAGIVGKPVLAVAERFTGAAAVGSGGEDLASDARRIATLASPNLARVREVAIRGDDLVVIGEFVEGEKLQELWRPDKLPLEIALRIIVDALAGVGALHNLRDSKQQPMKLAHGELSPATIALGLDGIARVLHAVSRRALGVEPDPASRGYLAPEVASGDPYDARADVFSAGVLLWEALSEKPLFLESDPEANARRVRAGPLPPATVPEKAAWARGLVEVTAKALAAAPDARWPTAAVMAAEVRKAAGLKLAPASTAAAFARSAFGERVKARRESLDAGSTSGRPPAPVAPGPAAPAPPPRPPKLPEPSFLEVDLESAVDTVLVAPGLRAPLEEVIELGSELLLESASNSSIPPAASSSLGGFVRDPFSAPGAPAHPPPPPAHPPPPPEAPRLAPPPPPAVAVAPVLMVHSSAVVEEPAPSSITGAPHFAAAIHDPPPPPHAPPAPPLAAPFVAPEPPEAPAVEDYVVPTTARRLRVLVLGGVAALGLIVLALVAVRLVRKEPDATPVTSAPLPPVVSAVLPPPPPTSAAASAPAPPAPSPPPTPAATALPVPAQTATLRPTLPAAKPAPVVAAAKPFTPPAHAPAAAKPRPKPTFDPNSL